MPYVKARCQGQYYKVTSLGISADGIFGANTKAEVISYQKANGLSADGIVGPNTWKKLLGL